MAYYRIYSLPVTTETVITSGKGTQLEVLTLRPPPRGAASFRELNIIDGDISSV